MLRPLPAFFLSDRGLELEGKRDFSAVFASFDCCLLLSINPVYFPFRISSRKGREKALLLFRAKSALLRRIVVAVAKLFHAGLGRRLLISFVAALVVYLSPWGGKEEVLE